MKNKLCLFGVMSMVGIYLLLTPACFKKSASAATNSNFSDSITSIKSLRKMHIVGMAEYIGQPIYIQGTVVANDEHDNVL